MADIFSSAKAVLRRANHHITDLKSEINRISPNEPYTHVIEQDAETGDYLQILRFNPNFSEDISCILFDAINNLRSCLDQMTWAIATKHTGGSQDVVAHFPFASDASHWPNKINGLKNVPSEIRARFEGFKAYKGGNNTLWALNYLANVKKHALLIPMWFGGTTVRIPAGSTVPPFAVTPKDRAKKDEIVIFRSKESPNAHPNIEITYRIVIDHPEEIIKSQPPVALLNTMRSEVAQILATTENECRRIGLIV